MGHSREDCKSISIFNQTTNPAPGNYNPFREVNKSVTMSPKLKFPSLWNASQAPGPGACTLLMTQMNTKRLIRRVRACYQSTRVKMDSRSILLVRKSRTKQPLNWDQAPTKPSLRPTENSYWLATVRRSQWCSTSELERPSTISLSALVQVHILTTRSLERDHILALNN